MESYLLCYNHYKKWLLDNNYQLKDWKVSNLPSYLHLRPCEFCTLCSKYKPETANMIIYREKNDKASK